MPLVQSCPTANIMGATLPPIPAPTVATRTQPTQGDHVLGDVIGAMTTAMQAIFGGGAIWLQHLSSYNQILERPWLDLSRLDLGHALNAPIVGRNDFKEYDQHAHMFGIYSARLQWTLCEIVCLGDGLTGQARIIAGATRAWKSAVMAALDDLLNHLVDETALHAYIRNPTAIRHGNITTQHRAISLAAAIAYTGANHGIGKARVAEILANYSQLRPSVAEILARFHDRKKIFNPTTTTPSWI